MSKSTLGIILSKLKVFVDPKIKLEQYPTDSEIAAEVVWQAYVKRDVEGKTITDLGCGTGILGIAALILGAAQVNFVDIDKDCVNLAKKNLALAKKEVDIKGKAKFIVTDIEHYKEPTEIIICNPPFGTKLKGADKTFLEKAFKIARIIYSFHKTSTKFFLGNFIRQNKFEITNEWVFKFPLKLCMPHHDKPVKMINVVCLRMQKTE